MLFHSFMTIFFQQASITSPAFLLWINKDPLAQQWLREQSDPQRSPPREQVSVFGARPQNLNCSQKAAEHSARFVLGAAKRLITFWLCHDSVLFRLHFFMFHVLCPIPLCSFVFVRWGVFWRAGGFFLGGGFLVILVFCVHQSVAFYPLCLVRPCCLASLLAFWAVNLFSPGQVIASFSVPVSSFVWIHSYFWFAALCLVFWSPIHLLFNIPYAIFTFLFYFWKINIFLFWFHLGKKKMSAWSLL